MFRVHVCLCVCVYVFFVRVKKEAGRDQCHVCLGQLGCCCTIKSHQFSSVTGRAWSQRCTQENVPGRGAEPGSSQEWMETSPLVHPLSFCPSTQRHTVNVSLAYCVSFLQALGSCSTRLTLGTFTSPKLNRAPSCSLILAQTTNGPQFILLLVYFLEASL